MAQYNDLHNKTQETNKLTAPDKTENEKKRE